jgi:hypothetical protein
VQLALNPKSIKATMTGDEFEKPETKDKNFNYRYRSPPGIPIKTLELSVRKGNPAAWEFLFEERERLDVQGPQVTKEDLAPSGGLAKFRATGRRPAGVDTQEGDDLMGREDYEITGGALKGAILRYIPDGNGSTDNGGEGRGGVELMSTQWAIEQGIRR